MTACSFCESTTDVERLAKGFICSKCRRSIPAVLAPGTDDFSDREVRLHDLEPTSRDASETARELVDDLARAGLFFDVQRVVRFTAQTAISRSPEAESCLSFASCLTSLATSTRPQEIAEFRSRLDSYLRMNPTSESARFHRGYLEVVEGRMTLTDFYWRLAREHRGTGPLSSGTLARLAADLVALGLRELADLLQERAAIIELSSGRALRAFYRVNPMEVRSRPRPVEHDVLLGLINADSFFDDQTAAADAFASAGGRQDELRFLEDYWSASPTERAAICARLRNERSIALEVEPRERCLGCGSREERSFVGKSGLFLCGDCAAQNRIPQ